MRPMPLTSATRRPVRQDHKDVLAEAGVGSTSQADAPQVNTQLAQRLPRPPVRAARLREPGEPNRRIGVRIASLGLQAAGVGSTMAAFFSGVHALQIPFAGAYGYATDDAWWKNYANCSALPVIASLGAMAGMSSVGRLATWYLQAQQQPPVTRTTVTKAARARELGITEECLDAAIEMVTMLDTDTPAPEMNEGERNALAMDLIHLATADRSLLPSELWDAASGVGDDAYALVDGLLSAARSRASAEASASSSS
ncbi:type III secretion system effector XopAV [Xanthomonas fragariae]|uniref:type III secretion system effector XopAV n=2 Tax=Xanthomonas fragariae TaxID=48664 RepID=UPI0031F32912